MQIQYLVLDQVYSNGVFIYFMQKPQRFNFLHPLHVDSLNYKDGEFYQNNNSSNSLQNYLSNLNCHNLVPSSGLEDLFEIETLRDKFEETKKQLESLTNKYSLLQKDHEKLVKKQRNTDAGGSIQLANFWHQKFQALQEKLDKYPEDTQRALEVAQLWHDQMKTTAEKFRDQTMNNDKLMGEAVELRSRLTHIKLEMKKAYDQETKLRKDHETIKTNYDDLKKEHELLKKECENLEFERNDFETRYHERDAFCMKYMKYADSLEHEIEKFDQYTKDCKDEIEKPIFNCFICGDDQYFYADLVQCNNNHLICKQCFERLQQKKCPICRSDKLEKKDIHNIQFKNADKKSLKIPEDLLLKRNQIALEITSEMN